jgi:carnitine-CoA ligase
MTGSAAVQVPVAMPQVVRDQALSEPNRPFLQEVDGRALAYSEADEEARRWAGALRRLGVVNGDNVAVMLPTSATAVTVWMGLGWLRAVEVPVNTSLRGRFLQHVLSDASARVLIVLEPVPRCDRGGHRLRSCTRSRGGRRQPGAWTDPRFLCPELEGQLVAIQEGPDEWDVGTILYTSGTTGMSKGVLVTWGQLHATAVGSFPLRGPHGQGHHLRTVRPLSCDRKECVLPCRAPRVVGSPP